MGIVAGLGAAAAATTIAGNLGVFGGDGGGGGASGQSYGGSASTYVPTAQPAADTAYQSLFNAETPYATALPGQVIPGYQTYAQNIQNNPYALGAQTGANNIAALGQVQGRGDINYANALGQSGQQILTNAFDPQTALYNRDYNRADQGAVVANAQSGVSGPYAAGVIGQQLQNFNTSWDQQQLQREISGLQGAGQAFAGAGALGNTGLGALQLTSALPYQTYNTAQNNDISALGALTGGVNSAFGPAGDVSNALAAYLGIGQRGTALAQSGQAQGFNQSQTLGNEFGQGLSALGNSLGSLFSSGGGNVGTTAGLDYGALSSAATAFNPWS